MPTARDAHLVTVRFHFSETVVLKGRRVPQNNMRVVGQVDGLVCEYEEDVAPIVLRHEDPVRGPVTVRRIGDTFHASVSTAPELRMQGPISLEALRTMLGNVGRGLFLLGGYEFGAHGEGLEPGALRFPVAPPAHKVKEVNKGIDALCVVAGEVRRVVHEPYLSFRDGEPTVRLNGVEGPDARDFEWSHADWYSLDEMDLAARFEGVDAIAGLTVAGDVPGKLSRRVAVQHLDGLRKLMVGMLEEADEPFFAAYVRLRALSRRVREHEGEVTIGLFEEIRRESSVALPHVVRVNGNYTPSFFDKVTARLAAHSEADDTDADVLGFEAA